MQTTTTNNKAVRVVLMVCLIPSAFTENRQSGTCVMLKDAETAQRLAGCIPYKFFNPILPNCQYGIG